MIKASALSLCPATENEKMNLSIFRKNNQNIVIDGSNKESLIPLGVENLAYKLMCNDRLIKEYIISLRDNYKSKKEDFHFSLDGKTDEEKKIIIGLFKELYGIVSLIHYCPECQMLNGRIVLSSKAQMFILGQYMELAIYKQVKDILKELSMKHHKTFDLYRNVKVSTKEGKLKNEFDLVIESSDGLIYVIEVKSGQCFRDLYHYTEVGRTYGIVPDRFLLVNNWLTSEQCETAQYFCDYQVCNLEEDSFTKQLISMIERDI